MADSNQPSLVQPSEAVDLGITYRRLLAYLKPFLHFFCYAVLGFALYALSQPAFAILMEAFVNALSGELVSGLYLIPLACIAIAFFRALGSYLGSYYMAKVTENVVHRVRSDLFNNIVLLPISFFDLTKTGRLVSLFTYNTNIMTATTAKAVTIAVREGLTVIALFAYLFYENPKLTLIFLCLGPPVGWLISWIGKKIKRFGQGIQASMGELNHIAAEVFGGIRLVKSVIAEKKSSQRFFDTSESTKKLALKMAKVNSIYTPLMQMMVVVALALVMYVVLLSRDSMDPASLIAYVTAAALLPKPIRSLSSVHPQLLQGAVAAVEVFKHIDFSPELDGGEFRAGNIAGDLSFSDVAFAYAEAEQNVLDGISFSVNAGETVALVGRSGGGKSTLVNLIPRFYERSSGSILVDGIAIEDFQLSSLRQSIALVSQQVVLLNASIKENLNFGLEEKSSAEIETAARAANAHEFILNLPDGYDTVVGENGVLLSGGQRQRIAIARAILRDAPILILDEATSALDNESEVKVQNALDRVMKNRTTVVIAHRLSTIEHADKILLFDQGKIIEEGNHRSLMNKNGQYAKMVRRDFNEQ